MKAMVLDRFGGPESFRWNEWPMPEPGPGEVRIRIRAVALNPVDTKMRRGLLPVPLPEVLGRDAAGTVDAVGPGVTGFTPGDEVTAVLFGPRSNGAYAQYVCTPEAFICPKPPELSPEHGATLGVAGLTAYDAVVRKARPRPGETAFVAGASGGVGSFAVPLLRRAGVAKVIATAGSEKSAGYLTWDLGIPGENILRYRAMDREEMTRKIRESTEGRGVDMAFDFVGADMKKLCFEAAGFDGRIISTVEETPEFDFDIWRADASPFFAKSGTYHFVALSARARNGGPADWGVYAECMQALAALIGQGKLTPPKTTVLGEMTEATLREAHALLETGGVQGKLALRVPHEDY